MKEKYVGLAGGDFIAPPQPKKQAICLVFGQPGHGKTTLGLSGAPDPIAFFDVDKRGHYACQKAVQKGKKIHYMPVALPQRVLKMTDNELKVMAGKEVTKVRKNMEVAVRESEKGNIRTIVFDTMTEFASMVNMAVTGRADRKKDDFGKSVDVVKTTLTDIIRMTKETHSNLIMLARAKPVWEGGEPTGEYSYRGPDTLEFEADWAGHLRLRKITSIKRARQASEQHHEIKITKAGIDLKQLGEIYSDEEWNDEAYGFSPFVFACFQNYPNTEPEDWM